MSRCQAPTIILYRLDASSIVFTVFSLVVSDLSHFGNVAGAELELWNLSRERVAKNQTFAESCYHFNPILLTFPVSFTISNGLESLVFPVTYMNTILGPFGRVLLALLSSVWKTASPNSP